MQNCQLLSNICHHEFDLHVGVCFVRATSCNQRKSETTNYIQLTVQNHPSYLDIQFVCVSTNAIRVQRLQHYPRLRGQLDSIYPFMWQSDEHGILADKFLFCCYYFIHISSDFNVQKLYSSGSLYLEERQTSKHCSRKLINRFKQSNISEKNQDCEAVSSRGRHICAIMVTLLRCTFIRSKYPTFILFQLCLFNICTILTILLQ